jgi:hypothetical protein
LSKFLATQSLMLTNPLLVADTDRDQDETVRSDS